MIYKKKKASEKEKMKEKKLKKLLVSDSCGKGPEKMKRKERRSDRADKILQNHLTRREKQKTGKMERRQRWEWRIKKALMTFSALFLVFGLCMVDLGYSEMMDEEGKIVPRFRRIDQETVAVFAFGKSLQINMGEKEIKIEKDEACRFSDCD